MTSTPHVPYLFPAHVLSLDPRRMAVKRHHLHSGDIQRAITFAAHVASIIQRATAYTLRAAFALRIKEAGEKRLRRLLSS